MPTNQTHRRALLARTRTAALAVIAGSVLSGCETTPGTDEARFRPYQGTPTQSEPAQTNVNSGLAGLSAKTPPPTLIEGEPPAPADEAQAAQIAEAATLLDEYFARSSRGNASLADASDAATGGYDPSAELGPTGSSQYATNTTQAETTLAQAAPVQPDTMPAATGDDMSSGLLAFDDNEDPAIDSVLAAIDAADSSPALNRPVVEQQRIPQVDTPAATIADLGTDTANDTGTASGEAAPQTRHAHPAVIVENAPPIRYEAEQSSSGTMRVVDASPTQTDPITIPATNTGSNAAIDAAIAAELADDATLAAITSETTRAPAVPETNGSLQGRPVEESNAIASADGSIPRMSPRSPEERKNELVDELVAVLGEIAHASDEPYRMGLALAGLETLSPGALYELTESGVLMPDEVRTLLAAHEFLSGLSAGGGLPDPGSVSDLLGDVKERLDEHAPLKITAAELCTRVMGYGQYDMFPKAPDGSYQFVSGRRQPVILYVEVDRFGRRPLVGDDGLARWEVVLSQTLDIYHDADDLLVMGRDAETDRSISRNKIRDYYLINQTYLPENLSIGRYNLKVTMRDENKQAVATSIIPVTIVPSVQGFGGGQ